MKFSIKNFFSKYEQISSILLIFSYVGTKEILSGKSHLLCSKVYEVAASSLWQVVLHDDAIEPDILRICVLCYV